MSITFLLNNEIITSDANPATLTLDFIRQHSSLKGSKEGCREGECGACSVLLGKIDSNNKLNYKVVPSCMLPLAELSEAHLVTIEGLNHKHTEVNKQMTPIQSSFASEGGTQCGFCTPGFIVSLSGFFLNSRNLSREDAISSLDGNICRCTGYAGILRAIDDLLNKFQGLENFNKQDRVQALVKAKLLPEYFNTVSNHLLELKAISLNTSPEKSPVPGQSIFIAGSTDLLIQKADQLENLEIILASKSHLNSSIIEEDRSIFIGALTTTEELKNSEILLQQIPQIENYINLISSTIIRNRATVGGNIANASPIGDLSIMLLALKAKIELVKADSKRSIPLQQFFLDYKKMDLHKDELINGFSFPVLENNSSGSELEKFHFEKVSRRKQLDIAAVNTAIRIKVKNNLIVSASLSAGGVAAVPLYLKTLSSFLENKTINAATVIEAIHIAHSEVSPISDIRGSADYKKRLLGHLIAAHFLELFPEQISFEDLQL